MCVVGPLYSGLWFCISCSGPYIQRINREGNIELVLPATKEGLLCCVCLGVAGRLWADVGIGR